MPYDLAHARSFALEDMMIDRRRILVVSYFIRWAVQLLIRRLLDIRQEDVT